MEIRCRSAQPYAGALVAECMKSRGEGLRGCEPTFSLYNFWPSVVLRLVLASLSLFSPGCCLFVNYIRYEEEAFCAGGKGVDRALKWMPGIEEIRRLLGPYLSSHCSSPIIPLVNPPLRTPHIHLYTYPHTRCVSSASSRSF